MEIISINNNYKNRVMNQALSDIQSSEAYSDIVYAAYDHNVLNNHKIDVKTEIFTTVSEVLDYVGAQGITFDSDEAKNSLFSLLYLVTVDQLGFFPEAKS